MQNMQIIRDSSGLLHQKLEVDPNSWLHFALHRTILLFGISHKTPFTTSHGETQLMRMSSSFLK